MGNANRRQTTIPTRRMPVASWERFDAFRNHDGTFHLNVVSGGGGYIFATGFNSLEEANWACALFNAAIGVVPPLPPDQP
jgi:hypothetical protein